MKFFASKNPKATPVPDEINAEPRSGLGYKIKSDRARDFFNPGPKEKEREKRTIQR